MWFQCLKECVTICSNVRSNEPYPRKEHSTKIQIKCMETIFDVGVKCELLTRMVFRHAWRKWFFSVIHIRLSNILFSSLCTFCDEINIRKKSLDKTIETICQSFSWKYTYVWSTILAKEISNQFRRIKYEFRVENNQQRSFHLHPFEILKLPANFVQNTVYFNRDQINIFVKHMELEKRRISASTFHLKFGISHIRYTIVVIVAHFESEISYKSSNCFVYYFSFIKQLESTKS